MLINNYLFYIDILLIIIRCMMFKPGSLTYPCSPALTVCCLWKKPDGLLAWGFCPVSINMSLAGTLSPFLSPRTRVQIACLSLRTTDLGHEILELIYTKHLSAYHTSVDYVSEKEKICLFLLIRK